MADLAALRARIDELDDQLLAVVAQRLEVCEQVAKLKETSSTPVIQPQRVRDVVTTRRRQALAAGIDPDFAEQLFRVLLTETHRIEVVGQRPDAAPEKAAAPNGTRSGLDTVASRIDHLVVAVHDVDAAAAALRDRFGFHDVPLADGPVAGMGSLAAGGVTVVLVDPSASPNVGRYLQTHGPGVQHVAVEVLNAGFTRSCLAESGATLLTDVLVDADGHEQFFAAADPAVGVQLGFLSRTGHRVGIGSANVLALFDTLQS